jgi:putative SbcD/Mre11-related phosphoesterase
MSPTRTKPAAGTFAFAGWLFTPEGAAVHRGERTAVVADVHLGYEWARGAAGDCVPPHSLDETTARLAAVLARAPIARLVIAGDLVESPRPCRRTDEDVRRLDDWLRSRGVTLLALEGNHDRGRIPGMRRRSAHSPSSAVAGASPLPSSCTVDGWTIAHGHRPIVGERTMSGHHHPVLRVEGYAAPCFLAGPNRIVLPAFSANAAGCDVVTGPIPADWLDPALRCIASSGSELLDFGPLPALRAALGRSPRSASRMPHRPGEPSPGKRETVGPRPGPIPQRPH